MKSFLIILAFGCILHTPEAKCQDIQPQVDFWNTEFATSENGQIYKAYSFSIYGSSEGENEVFYRGYSLEQPVYYIKQKIENSWEVTESSANNATVRDISTRESKVRVKILLRPKDASRPWKVGFLLNFKNKLTSLRMTDTLWSEEIPAETQQFRYPKIKVLKKDTTFSTPYGDTIVIYTFSLEKNGVTGNFYYPGERESQPTYYNQILTDGRWTDESRAGCGTGIQKIHVHSLPESTTFKASTMNSDKPWRIGINFYDYGVNSIGHIIWSDEIPPQK